MNVTELYDHIADLQGQVSDLCFHIKGSSFPIDVPEKARDELANLLRQAVNSLNKARALAYRIDMKNF